MPEKPSAGPAQIPQVLTDAALRFDFPLDLVRRALALGMPPHNLASQIMSGMRPEVAEMFIARQEAAMRGDPDEMMAPPLSLGWMQAPTEWGVRVKPGKKGLTLGSLNVGTYGDIPDHWTHQTELPRGAHPIAGVQSMGYTIYDKVELWADNAADLYEEGIARRWRPATEVPWETIEPLPEEVERAMDQLCTYFCEKALLAGDVVAKWLPHMSYGYHEVKCFLAVTEMDVARHFDVFRKRAFYNGGGLGIQSPGLYHRIILDARTWTEASLHLHVVSDSFLLGLYQAGEWFAHNAAEKFIFRRAIEDVSRHVAYGLARLKYVLQRQPERRAEMHRFLNKSEMMMIHEDDIDSPRREALLILLGGGLSKAQLGVGACRLEGLRARWARDYVRRLEWAGLPERRHLMHPVLRRHVLDDPAPAKASGGTHGG
jgi:hypothetical protein